MFDAGELHELLGELVGVERIQRILVLELRGEQRQKGLEVIRNSRRLFDEAVLLLEAVPVPGAETTVVGMVASTAIAISL